MQNIEVTTYNVNYSRRAEGGFEAFHWKNRSEDVYTKLSNVQSLVVFVQEVHNDYLDEFKKRLDNYNWYFKPQNSRNSITNIGVGVRNDYDKDYTLHEFNYNTFHEKCENVVGVYIDEIDTLFVSIHFPTSLTGRQEMVKNFKSGIVNNYPNSNLVVGGDFNSFPDGWGYTQIPSLNARLGTYSSTECALNFSNGKLATKSFKAYPYDFVPRSALELSGKLDHILVKGWLCNSAIVDDTDCEKKNFAASDHYPITVQLEAL